MPTHAGVASAKGPMPHIAWFLLLPGRLLLHCQVHDAIGQRAFLGSGRERNLCH